MEVNNVLALPEDHEGENIEPIVDMVCNQHKIVSLEKDMSKLSERSKRQHASVMKLEVDVQSAVSVNDLHAALGLAFEEVDSRLEETFRDSNAKFLSMFARRDDLRELQDVVSNKVTRHEHNAVMKCLSDLRTHFDSVTDSVFMRHIEAIKIDFARKADADWSQEQLGKKADLDDFVDVKARLERLEVLFAEQRAQMPIILQQYADKSAADLAAAVSSNRAKMEANKVLIAAIRADHQEVLKRLTKTEEQLVTMTEYHDTHRGITDTLQDAHENVVLTGIGKLQSNLADLEGFTKKAHAALEALGKETRQFHESAQANFKELQSQASSDKRQLELLMDAVEMQKRRAREFTKSNTAALKDLTEEQEKLAQQINAVEVFAKGQERKGRAVAPTRPAVDSGPTHQLRAPTPDAGSLRCITPDGRQSEANSTLEQLERIIAGASLPPEQPSAIADVQRPPLPWFDADGRPCTQGLEVTTPTLRHDATNLPRFTTPTPTDKPARPVSVAGHVKMTSAPRSKSARDRRKH